MSCVDRVTHPRKREREERGRGTEDGGVGRHRTAHERQRALTQKQTLWGGGALEHGDLGLLEDGGERRRALGSDVVAVETASKGWGEDGERAGVHDVSGR